MKSSILRNILFTFIGFGALIGIIFPFFAEFFVNFKDGLRGWFIFSCLIAGVLIGVANYYIINLILVSKLKRIAQVSTAISNHDLTFSCDIKSNDVIGEIIDSFNNMASTLSNVIGEIKSTSEQMLNGVNQICAVANSTSQGVQNQHSQTQIVEASIQHMSEIAQDVSSKAAEAAEAAAIAKEESEKGNNVVGETVKSIRNLASAVENASTSINRVEAESQNIGGVLDVIQGISEQTNLLALNAAIEAARAGEQGRGFAVVADEVRTLAQRTQESTKEIQTMIESLQAVARETVEVMEQGKSQANESVTHATAAGDSLQQIKLAVEGITEINTLINEKAGSQSGVAVETTRNMSDISAIAIESMDGADRTNQESQGLSNLAENLQQLVSKFKI